jgi:hypothetical protein
MSEHDPRLAEDQFERLVDAVLVDVGEPIFTLDETAKVVARLIAEERAAAKAEAWDEGFCDGRDWGAGGPDATNPYRADREASR